MLQAIPARAQPILIDASHRAGPVPAEPGGGVPVRWVHGYFAGYPFHIEDARDLLDERSLLPAFETWCGVLPHIDVGNRSVADSLGREAPLLLCAPFLSEGESAAVSCRRLPGIPSGRYWRNGGAAMRARGALAVREAGAYTLAWGHDDGVSFRFGTTRVYEFPDGTGSRVDVAAVRFESPGLYPFTLEWFDGIGGAIIDWYIARGERSSQEFSNFTFVLVPSSDLYPQDDRGCTPSCQDCTGATPYCDRQAGACVACLSNRECPPCQRCELGSCVTTNIDARCVNDAGSSEPKPDAAVADALPPPDQGASRPALTDSGCGCGVARRRGSPLLLALVGLLGVAWRRARR